MIVYSESVLKVSSLEELNSFKVQSTLAASEIDFKTDYFKTNVRSFQWLGAGDCQIVRLDAKLAKPIPSQRSRRYSTGVC